jgi:hypothetical protein
MIERHLLKVTEYLTQFLKSTTNTEEWRRDITRSYSMIISACGEVSRHASEPLKERLLQLAVMANHHINE